MAAYNLYWTSEAWQKSVAAWDSSAVQQCSLNSLHVETVFVFLLSPPPGITTGTQLLLSWRRPLLPCCVSVTASIMGIS